MEARKGPGVPSELELQKGAYGFASSFRGYTTAFIATTANTESWLTISVKDGVFDELLSSIEIK